MSLRLRLCSRTLLSAVALCLALSSHGCGKQQATAILSTTWALIAGTEPDPLTAKPKPCSDFGATTVRIQVTPGDAYDFPCPDYHGSTMAFEAGYYSVQVLVFGAFGKVLSTQEFPQTYTYGLTNLGDLRFQIR